MLDPGMLGGGLGGRGIPPVDQFDPTTAAPGSVYQGPGGLTFYFDGITLKPLSTSATSDRYLNLGNGRLFDTTTGQITDVGPGGAQQVHTTERLIDPAQIAVEQLRAQNAVEIERMRAAEQSARTEAERQYWAAQIQQKQAELAQQIAYQGGELGLRGAELSGLYGGQPTLAAQKQQFDQFKYLSDLASNPRNFMQSFFLHRGFQPPAGSERFGNAFGSPFAGAGAYPLPSFLAPPAGAPTGAGAPVAPPSSGVPGVPGTPALATPPAYGPGLAAFAPPPEPKPLPQRQADVATLQNAMAHPSGGPTYVGGQQTSLPANLIPFLAPGGPAVTTAPQAARASLAQPPVDTLSRQQQQDFVRQQFPQNFAPTVSSTPAPAAASAPRVAELGVGKIPNIGDISPTNPNMTFQRIGNMQGFYTPEAATQARQEAAPEPLAPWENPANFIGSGTASDPRRIDTSIKGFNAAGQWVGYDKGGTLGYARGGRLAMPKFLHPAKAGAMRSSGVDASSPDDQTGRSALSPFMYGSAVGYAQGGVTPEPIMGVGASSNPALFHALSHAPGHKYLIGEKGPEGVVPTKYLPEFLRSRHGKAVAGGDLASSDALYGTTAGGMGTTYGDGGMVGIPQGASGGDLMAMFAQGGPLGLPKRAEQAAMRTPLAGATMDGGAMGVNSDITAMADGGEIGQPSETNPYADEPNSPYRQLQASGAVPPFLQRALGQQRGEQSVGTNVPQKAYLPPNLPLESGLGYEQMSPSEQQALESYVSSYGVDPRDYLAQVRQQVAPARRRQRIEFAGQ